MKLKIISIISLLSIAIITNSQVSANAKKMVGIKPIVSENLSNEISDNVKRTLLVKMRSLATKNGFGATSNDFVIYAEPNITNKQMTTSMPPQFVVDVDISIYVVNNRENIIVNEITIPIKGIDRIEDRAISSAINNLQTTNPQIRKFMDLSRTKIIEYYSLRVPKIMEKANQLANQEQYKQAVEYLAQIPEFVDQYSAALAQMTNIYRKQLEVETTELIVAMTAEIAKGNYNDALTFLSLVDPLSPNAKDAYALMDKIILNLNDSSEFVVLKESLDAKRKMNIELSDSIPVDIQEQVREKINTEASEENNE